MHAYKYHVLSTARQMRDIYAALYVCMHACMHACMHVYAVCDYVGPPTSYNCRDQEVEPILLLAPSQPPSANLHSEGQDPPEFVRTRFGGFQREEINA